MNINDLKIYVQDRGTYGSIVVIAKNEQQAHELMSGEENYQQESGLQEFPIKDGFIFSNLGGK